MHRLLTWSPGARSEPGLADLARGDLLWAAGAAALSAGLFATALSSHPALSDGSEAVAGVASLGILHAPGYPAYVLAAKLFTLIFPVGDMALRVGLFSLVCASASVALVVLLARRFGAERWAAALGALCLAASAGYWYYAVFTKHDQFSGLIFLLTLYLALAWDARPSTRRLVGLGAAIAIGLGSSWPLEITLMPVILYVLARSWRRLTLAASGAAALVGVVLLVGVYGFVVIRAGENPALNWGDATSLSRLVSLVARSDFTNPNGNQSSTAAPTSASSPGAGAGVSPGGSPAAGTPAPAGGGTAAPAGAGAVAPAGAGAVAVGPLAAVGAQRAASDFEMLAREFGILGSLLALWGLLGSLSWRRRRASLALAGAFLFNLLAGLTVAPLSSGYDAQLIEEGFLLGCYFAMACWVAIGATDLLARLRELVGRRAPQAAAAPAEPPRRRLPRAAASARTLTAPVAALLAAGTIAPLVIAGWPVAHRSDNRYAAAYARTAFAELPRRAIVFTWGSDLNFPLEYEQIVNHLRPDVAVITIGGLRYSWYRQEVGRELGRALPPQDPNTLPDIVNVIRWSQRLARPVYVDEQATENLKGQIGVKTVGLLSGVTAGTSQTALPPGQLERILLDAEHAAGMPSPDWTVWPNSYLNEADYASLGLKIARFYYQQRNFGGLRKALLNVARIDPGNATATRDLSLLASGGAPGG